MRTVRSLLVATILAATIAAPFGGMANAAPSRVVVALRFSVGYPGEPLVHTMNECSVKVPRGGNGIAVLKAAKRARCIDSYVLSRSRYGVVDSQGNNSTYVACINGICRAGFTVWWLVYYGGPDSFYGDHRLERYRAGRSTTLEFRHTLMCC